MFSFEGFVRIDTFLKNVYRVGYLNLLWVVTTVLGLGVFGFGPASYALAKYLDRWIRHGETPPPARTFFAHVREQTWHAMLVGWILLGAGAVIITNVFLAPSWGIRAVNVVALVVLAVATAYVFPVMVATDLRSVPRQLAAAVLIGFGSLHWTIVGAAAAGLTWWLMWQFASPLLLLFGIGIPACAIAWVTRIIFRPLESESDRPGRLSHQFKFINSPATEQVS